MAWIAEHIELLLALTACGIALWGVFSGVYSYVPALALAGAVSFFVGFLASLCVSGLLESYVLFQPLRLHHAIDIAVVMVEVFGYGCVAWLGYRHREQQRRQKEMALKVQHGDSVLPWMVANEVRTSLAAIRFLLFPLNHSGGHVDASHDPLRQATDELQRLEQIFNNMEKKTGSGSQP